MTYGEQEALVEAVEAARFSPCAKSQRGVVIWRPGFPLMSTCRVGFNHPPEPFKCDGSQLCRESCNKLCVHAEQAALLQFAAEGLSTDGCHMLHVKVVQGEPVVSGPPSCWQCSRMLLSARLEAMWLLHEEGLRRYSPQEFHRLTLLSCGLPVIE